MVFGKRFVGDVDDVFLITISVVIELFFDFIFGEIGYFNEFVDFSIVGELVLKKVRFEMCYLFFCFFAVVGWG